MTTLSLHAQNNSGIGSASMGVVSGLTGLTRLQWHAGDSLDMSVDPVVLKVRRRAGRLGGVGVGRGGPGPLSLQRPRNFSVV